MRMRKNRRSEVGGRRSEVGRRQEKDLTDLSSSDNGQQITLTKLLSTRPVVFIGLISYSLYIWQQPFFIWPSDFGFSRLITFEWPFNILGMTLVAIASYFCLERPLVSLRHALAARRT